MKPVQGSSRPSLPSADDHTLYSLIIIVAGSGVLGWMLWSDYHTEISTGFVQVAHWHIQVIRWFTPAYDQLDAAMLAADPRRMTIYKLREVSVMLGSFFRWPAALLLAGLGVLCFLRAGPARFTRKLDLEALMREQATQFRSTAAFVERKLGIVPPREGQPRPMDSALHPEEWIERFATIRGSYDDTAARVDMVRQLGPLWHGVKEAPPHVRVLYAAFALHLLQRRTASLSLLGDMAEALAKPEPGEGPAGPEHPLLLPPHVVKHADEVLRDPHVTGTAKAVTALHGYTTPALMNLLTESRRRSGVLAPAQFNCLKLVDRPLWYALHSLGFPAEGLGEDRHPNPLIEAIGARDHWASERAARSALMVPAIDRAAAAVRAVAAHAAGVSKTQERS